MNNHQKVEEIVTEVLQRMELLHKGKNPQLLVIHQQSEISRAQIEELKRHWNIVEMTSGSSQIPLAVQRAVFLEVNQDLLVKGAIGITDSPDSLLFSKLMFQGCQVDFVPDNLLWWSLNLDIDKQVNKKYISKLLHYQTQLQDFGVQIRPLKYIIPKEEEESMSSAIKEPIDFFEKLLTKGLIEEWKHSLIRVQPNTIITPLALDMAKEMGITICRSESKGEGKT
jgi:hypothetical protein